ncbi:hypothetical protein PX52LOC_03396 [Limnoglobus roseus]|uniref:Uncharacterized protein n=1 Tax=Limnoglobus roseus TaxID=2598579 RepID=A0A5C1AFD7_9BACT|nr:hypothetical protein PX52LOC_03396 [Limnoglobus roseus]
MSAMRLKEAGKRLAISSDRKPVAMAKAYKFARSDSVRPRNDRGNASAARINCSASRGERGPSRVPLVRVLVVHLKLVKGILDQRFFANMYAPNAFND